MWEVKIVDVFGDGSLARDKELREALAAAWEPFGGGTRETYNVIYLRRKKRTDRRVTR